MPIWFVRDDYHFDGHRQFAHSNCWGLLEVVDAVGEAVPGGQFEVDRDAAVPGNSQRSIAGVVHNETL